MCDEEVDVPARAKLNFVELEQKILSKLGMFKSLPLIREVPNEMRRRDLIHEIHKKSPLYPPLPKGGKKLQKEHKLRQFHQSQKIQNRLHSNHFCHMILISRIIIIFLKRPLLIPKNTQTEYFTQTLLIHFSRLFDLQMREPVYTSIHEILHQIHIAILQTNLKSSRKKKNLTHSTHQIIRFLLLTQIMIQNEAIHEMNP